jgi:hypothetical protein
MKCYALLAASFALAAAGDTGVKLVDDDGNVETITFINGVLSVPQHCRANTCNTLTAFAQAQAVENKALGDRITALANKLTALATKHGDDIKHSDDADVAFAAADATLTAAVEAVTKMQGPKGEQGDRGVDGAAGAAGVDGADATYDKDLLQRVHQKVEHFHPPTQFPTAAPTAAPTNAPTMAPTAAPTAAPTPAPPTPVPPTPAPTSGHTYQKLTQRACSGRNEIASRSGISFDDAKVHCSSISSCVSFENMSGGGSGNSCTSSCLFQFSTSCSEAASTHYSSYSLYVKKAPQSTTPSFKKLTQRACGGRNEIAGRSGISLNDAKAHCSSLSNCVSFENMSGGGSGSCTSSCTFQFSTSCSEVVSTHYSSLALYIKQ